MEHLSLWSNMLLAQHEGHHKLTDTSANKKQEKTETRKHPLSYGESKCVLGTNGLFYNLVKSYFTTQSVSSTWVVVKLEKRYMFTIYMLNISRRAVNPMKHVSLKAVEMFLI